MNTPRVIRSRRLRYVCRFRRRTLSPVPSLLLPLRLRKRARMLCASALHGRRARPYPLTHPSLSNSIPPRRSLRCYAPCVARPVVQRTRCGSRPFVGHVSEPMWTSRNSKGSRLLRTFCRPLPYTTVLRRSASSMLPSITIAQVPELLAHMIRASTATFVAVSTWPKASCVAGGASTAATISWSVSPLAGLIPAHNMRNGWRCRAIRWVLMTSLPPMTLRVA